MGVLGVHRVDHPLRVREALPVEVVRAPAVLGPVEPVLHDVIERPAALAVFEHGIDHLLLAQEGLYFQEEVEDLLFEIRDGGDLCDLARRGGPIISRYERMRRDLRHHADPSLRPYTDALDEVFANHSLLLHSALDLRRGAHDTRPRLQ